MGICNTSETISFANDSKSEQGDGEVWICQKTTMNDERGEERLANAA